MKVNNIRARLESGGDLFSQSQYITPFSSIKPVSGIFGAGLWLGGTDRANNVKVSVSTYKTIGNDFFSGPLDNTGQSSKEICSKWDNIFSVSGANIRKHINNFKISQNNGQNLQCTEIPEDILYWPAQGNIYFEEKYGWVLPDQSLAGYFDMDNNGVYNACKGDYPMLHDNNSCNYYHEGWIIPSEINYFVYNDAGGMQSTSGIANLMMEIHVNAYAYTSHELNDMSFYQYKMINKSNEDILDFNIAFWIDPDLGCPHDDYIGCNPDSGMAYIYNEDEIDGNESAQCQNINTYGNDIPIIGFDYVQGPWVYKVFKKNVDGTFTFDASGNKILEDIKITSDVFDTIVRQQMSSFIYYENASVGNPASATTDPNRGQDDNFFNYMKGFWKDGTPITKGNSGYNPGSAEISKYVFPDDPSNVNGWSMCSSNLGLGDRRILMTVGPSFMNAGQTNDFTFSIFSVFDIDYPCPDLSKLKYTNQSIQNFFDNCVDNFNTFTPDAPIINGTEKINQIELKILNDKTSNNYQEKFVGRVRDVEGNVDSFYRFEGYRIFQLKNKDVSFSQLDNPLLAKEIGQSDIHNGITDIYTWQLLPNPSLSGERYVWLPKLSIIGMDQGLKKTYTVDKDAFAVDDDRLINGREYHFAAIAYAHNNWKPFDTLNYSGQKNPYLTGASNFKVYTFVPNNLIYNSVVQPVITRIAGEGNPSVFLEVEDNLYNKILNGNFDGKIKYKPDAGPLLIRVTYPTKALGKKYRLEINGNFNFNSSICNYDNDSHWTLTDVVNNQVILENIPLHEINEYAIKELGFSIVWHNHPDPSNLKYAKNGGKDIKLKYKNTSGERWFNAIKDGGYYDPMKPPINVFDYVSDGFIASGINLDPYSNLANLGDGYFVPILSSRYQTDVNLPNYISPAPKSFLSTSGLKYNTLNNVDIVFTNDKSKWSKCIVLETTPDNVSGTTTIGNAKNFELRKSISIDKDGKELNDGTVGYSYFPGYVIDVETGKRLNIFFGESSWFSGENAEYMNGKLPIGGDLIFNPSSEAVIDHFSIKNPINGTILGATDLRAWSAGAQHYIYVTRMEYDECKGFYDLLKYSSNGSSPSFLNKQKVLASVTWTSVPLPFGLLSLDKGLIPNDLSVQIRVNNPYSPSRKFNLSQHNTCLVTGDHPVYEINFEKYVHNIGIKIDREVDVYIIPNPSLSVNGSGSITLANTPKNGQINIFDCFGKLIESIDISLGTSSFLGPKGNIHTFDLVNSNLKSGIYFLNIEDFESGSIQTVKWLLL
jgi:hypothetical protein